MKISALDALSRRWRRIVGADGEAKKSGRRDVAPLIWSTNRRRDARRWFLTSTPMPVIGFRSKTRAAQRVITPRLIS